MLYEDLYEISKLLLAEDDSERTPEVLLRRLVERCGAETGFVVVRYLYTGDAAGTAQRPLDPRLLPLDETTPYPPFHEPDPRSLGFGNPYGCRLPDGMLLDSDQLGQRRPQGAACDADAIETAP